VALALIARAPSPLLRSVPLVPDLEASIAPLQVPPETPPAALLSVTQVMLAAERQSDPLYALIVDDLAATVAATGAARPPVVDDRAPMTAGTVRVGGRDASRPGRALLQAGALAGTARVSAVESASPRAGADLAADGFRLYTVAGDGGPVVVVEGASPRGDAYGVYWLAEAIARWGGVPLPLDEARAPAIAYRYVDAFSPLYSPDRPTDGWGEQFLFAQLDLDTPPYVDEARLAAAVPRFAAYARWALRAGFNGLVLGDLLHLVDFDDVEGGAAIYPADSPYRQRHAIYRRYFTKMLDYAHALHLDVVVTTDVAAYTPPLLQSLGGLNPADGRLGAVYAAGMRELFAIYPQVTALMVRIGEGGGAYNSAFGYRSRVVYRSVDDLRRLLGTLLPVAEAAGRLLILRTWTVGIGLIGDLHADPALYTAVFAGFDSPSLVASVKYGQGDFFSYVPLNRTLGAAPRSVPQIVELQAKREYEGQGLYPDYTGPLYAEALREAVARGAAGVWVWAQGGGWGGPPTLYRSRGEWTWVDANVDAAARLAWTPTQDVGAIAADWARAHFGADAVDATVAILGLSRAAVRAGLYLEPYAERVTYLAGTWLPPLLWIWWDTPTGADSALAIVYAAARGALDRTVDAGFAAVETARTMEALGPALRAEPRASLTYERRLLAVLAWYRAAFLRYYQWQETGDAGAEAQFRQALVALRTVQDEYLAVYAGDAALPPYDLREVDVFVRRAAATETVRLAAAASLLGVTALTALTARRGRGACAAHARAAATRCDATRTAVLLGSTALLAAWVGVLLNSFVGWPLLALWGAAAVLGYYGAHLAALAIASWVAGRRPRLAGVLAGAAAPLLPLCVALGVALGFFALWGPSLLRLRLWIDGPTQLGAVAALLAVAAWSLQLQYQTVVGPLGFGVGKASLVGALANGLLVLGLLTAWEAVRLSPLLHATNQVLLYLPTAIARGTDIADWIQGPDPAPLLIVAAVVALIGVLGRVRWLD
jgi:hypothetical protein